MPRIGRPKAELVLSAAESSQLTRWVRSTATPQALALRSRIVLACAQGLDNKAVAAQLRCSENTVGKWRARFLAERLDGLRDEPRPGRPRSIGAEQVARVIAMTSTPPPNALHWTRAAMAGRTGLSQTTIGRIWKDAGIVPHRHRPRTPRS